MFRPLHISSGTITQAVSPSSNLISVSPTLYALVLQRLPSPDHTYMRIVGGGNIEVVRVRATNDFCILAVDRNIDNTPARSFYAGSTIEYVFAAQAARDIFDEYAGTSVVLTAGEGIDIEQTAVNRFTISSPITTVASGDNSLVVLGTAPNLDIRVNSQNNTCC